MNRNLDYSPLELSPNVRPSRVKGILLLGIYLIVFFASFTIVPVLWGETAATVVFMSLVLGVPFAVNIVDRVKKAFARPLPMSEDKMVRFALANHARLIRNEVPSGGGRIFTVGLYREITEAVRFDDGLEIGNYKFDEYTGRLLTKREMLWGYVKVPLSRSLPNMYLDGRNNQFGLGYTLSSRVDVYYPLDQRQRIKLEGDFNKYFTLYVPRGYERDALYIFTPDVMVDLIDHGKKYDVEIVDNELYFYGETAFPLDDPEFYKQELPTFDTIKAEITKQADNYADDRVFDARRLNAVAEQGATLGNSSQLKSGLLLGGILTLCCALMLVVFLLIFK